MGSIMQTCEHGLKERDAEIPPDPPFSKGETTADSLFSKGRETEVGHTAPGLQYGNERRHMLKHIIRYAMIAGMLFMLSLSFTTCGKKGPPHAPGYLEPPVVDDLRYQIIGEKLMLEWTVPESGEERVYDIAGAKVYRFKTPAKDAACKDCPLTLSLAAKIPFKSPQMNYSEVLEIGYQYAYQVVLYGKTDREGEKSNIVDFMHDLK